MAAIYRDKKSNTMNPDINKELDRIRSLSDQELENYKHDLERQLDDILSSRAYNCWTHIVKTLLRTKRIATNTLYVIPSLLKILIRVCFLPIYFSFISLFYLVFLLTKLCIFFIRKPLTLNQNHLRLDGFSIIIPTWNKAQLVFSCVKNIDNCLQSDPTNVPAEVIIVDNGSADGTVSLLQSYKTKLDLQIIEISKNVGFAKAINAGVKAAKYNYVYLMNNDMFPATDHFAKLIEYAHGLIKSGQRFFGIASQIFFYDPSKRREESGKTYIKFKSGIPSIAHYVNKSVLERPGITLYPGGGSSLINKRLFTKLGGYDYHSYTPMYVEDAGLGYTAWKKGYPSFFFPEAKIIHYHRSSSKLLNIDPNFMMYKNWWTFFFKELDNITIIAQHYLFSPLLITLNALNFKYSYTVMLNLHRIFVQKIKLLKYKDKYSDLHLMDFTKFETEYEE